MRTPNLEIYDGMPDHTNLKAKDVMRVFGYKGKIGSHVRRGYIPDSSLRFSDFDKKSFSAHGQLSKHESVRYWKLGDLRKLKAKMETAND